jgi:superfamily II DNA/RNA helicase
MPLPTTRDAPCVTFSDLGLPTETLRRLREKGLRDPFPIQAAVIPDVLAGRHVAGRAPTGSGKTLAFGLPIIAGLRDAEARRPTALVLAPTRELAEQIMNELVPFAAAHGHRAVALYGGVGYGTQTAALRRGAELVVACPGRLEDLLSSGAIDLRDVATVVIDEADQMSDMGFLPAVRRIVDRTPTDRQVLLFSATLDGPVAALVEQYQDRPRRHEVGPAGPDLDAARHEFWTLDRSDRIGVTADVVNRLGSTIIFTRTRHGADRVARQLAKQDVAAAAIHGGHNQGKRTRALSGFRDGSIAALVATDVAARGIHVDAVGAVVHFDPPADAATYTHRSGRTARAGASGTVISLVDPTQAKSAMSLARAVGIGATLTDPDPDGLGESGAATEAAPTTEEPRGPRPEQGVVEFFDAARGYGFIRPSGGGRDLFFHHTNVATDVVRTLDNTAAVSYAVRPGRRGPEAFDVRITG